MARKKITKNPPKPKKSKAKTRLYFGNCSDLHLDMDTSAVSSSLTVPNSETTMAVSNTDSETTVAVPQSEEARTTRTMGEIMGIPVINLSAIVEDAQTDTENEDDDGEGWTTVSDDVQPEIEYWSSAVVCYVLEGNSPWELLSGFINRLWGKYKYDKISFLPNGAFLVHFPTLECKTLVLQQGFPMFNNKPLIVKPWSEECSLAKEKVKFVPIWVRLCGLPLKFWGASSLAKISTLLGKFMRCDAATMEKTKLGYARIMIEVEVGQKFPDKIFFKDAKGNDISVLVEYEWKPDVCASSPTGGTTVTYVVATLAASGGLSRQDGHHVSPITTVSTLVRQEFQTSTIVRPLGSPTYAEVVSPKGHGNGGLSISPDSLYGLVETKIKTIDCTGMLSSFGQQWRGVSNIQYHPGGRIWLIWLDHIFNVNVISMSDQQITARVVEIASGNEFLFSVIYGSNDDGERLLLWDDLKGLKDNWNGPWSMCGDFNNLLDFNEGIGRPVFWNEIVHFKECVCLTTTLTYAIGEWLGKLDPISVVTKQRSLKYPLKQLNRNRFSDVEKVVEIAKIRLTDLQIQMHNDPTNPVILESKSVTSDEYRALVKANFSFLSQKAKIKARQMHNKILQIHDKEGLLHTSPQNIEHAFLDYYIDLSGTNAPTASVHTPTVRAGPLITDHHINILMKPVHPDEVKNFIFAIPATKSPGSDGFNSQFYRDSWDVIGRDITGAVLDFFATDLLPAVISFTSASQKSFALDLERFFLILSIVAREGLLKETFRFHPMCGHIRLNHLLFADDLLMFCKDNVESIMWLLKAFSTFPSSSGLCLNRDKTDIYFNGLRNEIMEDIIKISGFRSGKLPFKYLGVPISSKKITKLATKKDHLWVKWVNHVYMKGNDWRDYTTPSYCSWSWKKIIHVKDIFKQGYTNDLWQNHTSPYFVAAGYHWLRTQTVKVPWRFLCWNNLNVPKHSFIFWASQHCKLFTLNRMARMGLGTITTCFICGLEDQSHAHLFYNYVYRKKCVGLLQDKLQLIFPADNMIKWYSLGRG
ncbi:uncharacterized protein LOC141649548 [Silene latifolia]|uniref:uncharacterized protein LOC141649548 n=1 Tax=Silene latifolia TaxID=37657 RepID=UPI003D76E0BF